MFALIALLAVQLEPNAASVEAAQPLDSIQVVDTAVLLKPLTGKEIAKLERKRMAEYRHIKWIYRKYTRDVWEAQMTLWLKHTYDSLKVNGKNPWDYYAYLKHLMPSYDKPGQFGIVLYYRNGWHYGLPTPNYPD